MSLNIKNAETYRLIRELAEVTGESMTTAVTVAVQDRLTRLRRSDPGSGMADRLHEIATDMRARLPEDFLVADPVGTLYDRDGLPK